MTTCSRPCPELSLTSAQRAHLFDTNVLVSVFLARGLCADLLRLVLSEQTLVTSEVVLAELRDVLSRKGRLPQQQIDAIVSLMRDQPVAARPVQALGLGLVDADDEWVLACKQPPLPLCNPRGCWERLRSMEGSNLPPPP
ncbi:MAG: PIN domain-containing protein [Synechococcaceae cyanobacterium]|nr:PIN domain-containing protein [Synechococcaceae cyanobacterium]